MLNQSYLFKFQNSKQPITSKEEGFAPTYTCPDQDLKQWSFKINLKIKISCFLLILSRDYIKVIIETINWLNLDLAKHQIILMKIKV